MVHALVGFEDTGRRRSVMISEIRRTHRRLGVAARGANFGATNRDGAGQPGGRDRRPGTTAPPNARRLARAAFRRRLRIRTAEIRQRSQD